MPLTGESEKFSWCFCKLWEILQLFLQIGGNCVYFTSVHGDERRGGLTRPLSTISFCKFVDVITRSLMAWNEEEQVLVFDADFIQKDQFCQWWEVKVLCSL